MTAQDREMIAQVDLALRVRSKFGITMMDAVNWVQREFKTRGSDEAKLYFEAVIKEGIEGNPWLMN